MILKKGRRKKLIKTFTAMLCSGGKTTTLEVKEELRRLYPGKNWVQKDISETIIDLKDQNEIKDLEYLDNGKYREYFLLNAPTIKKVVTTTTYYKTL